MDTVKRLDDLLEERGMTLWELSKVSGLCYHTLKSARVRGAQLSVDMIEQACAVLDIPLSVFFDESSDNTRRKIS